MSDKKKVAGSAVEKIKRWVEAIQRNRLIMALVLLVQGIMTLISPINAMLGSAKTTAVLAAVAAVSSLVGFIRKKEERGLVQYISIAIDAVILAAGVFSFFQPGYLAAALKVILGIVIALNGLGNLLQALKVENRQVWQWWVSVIAALAPVVVGVLLVIYPFDSDAVLERFLAVSLIYTALNDLWAMWQLHKAAKAK